MIIKVWFTPIDSSILKFDGVSRSYLLQLTETGNFESCDLMREVYVGGLSYAYETVKSEFFVNFKHVLYFEILEED